MTGTTQDTTAPRSIDPAPTSPLDAPQAAPRDDLPAIRRDAAAALRALTQAVLDLDDEALGSPSSLDGWSVGLPAGWGSVPSGSTAMQLVFWMGPNRPEL